MSDKEQGRRLRKLREARGVKQSWVADKLGVTNQFLCMLEKGQRTWTDEMVAKYLKALA